MENKGKKVLVFEGEKDILDDIDMTLLNAGAEAIDVNISSVSIEEFNSSEEAFCHELASNYYDPKTETEQYKGLAEAFMNEDHLIDESVIMETVEAFKQM